MTNGLSWDVGRRLPAAPLCAGTIMNLLKTHLYQHVFDLSYIRGPNSAVERKVGDAQQLSEQNVTRCYRVTVEWGWVWIKPWVCRNNYSGPRGYDRLEQYNNESPTSSSYSLFSSWTSDETFLSTAHHVQAKIVAVNRAPIMTMHKYNKALLNHYIPEGANPLQAPTGSSESVPKRIIGVGPGQ